LYVPIDLPFAIADFSTEAESNRLDEIPLGELSSRTFLEHSRRTACQWLSQCVNNHRICNQNKPATPWYPTRLLYLGEPSMRQNIIRVIQTATSPPNRPYASLSHFWGGAAVLQLKRSLLDTFCTVSLWRVYQRLSRRLSL
jgi:hypothetical protein